MAHFTFTGADIPNLDRSKYLVPDDLTVGLFLFNIRRKMQLSPEKALYLFVQDYQPPRDKLFSSLYEEFKDEDGFLYISYTGENSSG